MHWLRSLPANRGLISWSNMWAAILKSSIIWWGIITYGEIYQSRDWIYYFSSKHSVPNIPNLYKVHNAHIQSYTNTHKHNTQSSASSVQRCTLPSGGWRNVISVIYRPSKYHITSYHLGQCGTWDLLYTCGTFAPYTAKANIKLCA